jgi:hypothetical protein
VHYARYCGTGPAIPTAALLGRFLPNSAGCNPQRNRPLFGVRAVAIIDIPGQFRKLCPSYSRSLDLGIDQMLETVEGHLERCRSASARGHWSYDLSRHLAFIELRDALLAEAAADERRAAA